MQGRETGNDSLKMKTHDLVLVWFPLNLRCEDFTRDCLLQSSAREVSAGFKSMTNEVNLLI